MTIKLKDDEPKYSGWYCPKCNTQIYMATQNMVDEHLREHTTPKPNGWEEKNITRSLYGLVGLGSQQHTGLQVEKEVSKVMSLLSQAILSAEERAVRDLIAGVGYRVETVLGYLEMGKTEEAIKHLENIHELFVTKPK